MTDDDRQALADELNQMALREYKRVARARRKFLSHRQQYAVAAMNGLLMTGDAYVASDLAEQAFEIADAMLAAEKKP